MAFLASSLPVFAANKSFTMTVVGYDSNRAALADFPVLVRLSESTIDGFSYSDIESGQSNLIFKDDSGKELPYEVDTWDATGTSLVWVKVPSLAQGTKIYAEYGEGVTRTAASTAVWGDYTAVWHLNETSGTANAVDATENAIVAVPTTRTDTLSDMASAAGKVGRCRFLSTARDRRNFLYVYDTYANTLNGLGSSFAVSGWFYANGGNVAFCERLLSRKKDTGDNGGWQITTKWDDATGICVIGGGSGEWQPVNFPSLNDGWVYLTVVYDGTSVAAYANGAQVATGTLSAAASDSANGLCLGYAYYTNEGEANFSGSMDEIRLGGNASARSADWAYADYKTQTDAAFLTYSEAESQEVAQVVPTVSVARNAAEPSTSGAFTISIPSALDRSLRVNYTASGSAVAGTDYVALSGSVKIPAGATSATVDVKPMFNLGRDADSTLTVSIAEGNYLASESSATMTIANSSPNYTRVPFTVTGTVDGTLEGFPVLVRLSESEGGFSYSDMLDPVEGGDLFFTDSSGAVIPHEIDTWEEGGTSLVWVRVPSFATGTTIYACYGNFYLHNDLAANVWSGYTGVWHMSEASGDVADATGNGLTATANNNGGATTGVIGNGRTNIGSQGGHSYLAVPSVALNGTFSFSGWFRATQSIGGYIRLFSRKKDAWNSDGWGWEQNGGDSPNTKGIARGSGDTSVIVTHPNISENTVFVEVVYSGTSLTVYIDGVQAGSGTISTAVDTGALWIGDYSQEDGGTRFPGWYDECRLSPVARSAAWVAAEYAVVTRASFLTQGQKETIGTPGEVRYARKSFTVTADGVKEDVTLYGFPLLVRISPDLINGFDYGDCLLDGSDLYFTDSDGNVLPHEIDEWRLYGESTVWVRVPTLTKGTVLTGYYGTGSAAGVVATDTWAGYAGVWHMSEASGDVADATTNGLTAADNNTVGATVGVIGRARMNANANLQTAYLLTPNYNSLNLGSTFVFSGWFHANAVSGNVRLFSRKRDWNADGWSWEQWESRTTQAKVRANGGSEITATHPDITAGWVYLSLVYDGSDLTVYGNGQEVAKGVGMTAVVDNGEGLYIGDYMPTSYNDVVGFNGAYDECRLRGGTVSADWVKTEYANVTDAEFLSYGPATAALRGLHILFH